MQTQSQINISTVKQRAVRGVFALSGRTFIVQLISSLGFFLLSIYLDQVQIGLFIAISEIVAILGYFSDIGLAAALIQKKEAPEKNDIQSTFTIQQIIVISLCLIILGATPWLKNYYQIPAEGVTLLYALVAGFFLSSLKTIPSVLLERQLRFDLMAVVEIFETLLYYGIAVFMAWRGMGLTSYAVAVLVRGLVGVVIINRFSPWPWGISFNLHSLKQLLKYGLPYQAQSLLAVVKDRLMNIFLWKIIGAQGVAILGWGIKWSQTPQRIGMDPIMKVTFPAYSRLQDSNQELSKAIEKTLFAITLIVFPFLVGILCLVQPFVEIFPRYQKWENALIPLYFLIINAVFSTVTTPLNNALAAIGKIKIVFNLMVMWTILTWILFPIGALKGGVIGISIASALVSSSSIIAIIIIKKYLTFNFWSSIKLPTIVSLIMGISLFALNSFLDNNYLTLIFKVIIGVAVYSLAVWFWPGKTLKTDLRHLLEAFKPSQP